MKFAPELVTKLGRVTASTDGVLTIERIHRPFIADDPGDDEEAEMPEEPEKEVFELTQEKLKSEYGHYRILSSDL